MDARYDTAAAGDPFARVLSHLAALIADLSALAALVLPHQEVEQIVAAGGREAARLLLQAHLDLRASVEEARLSALDGDGRAALAGGRTRLEAGHHRELATVVGTVTVTRCALRSPGRGNRCPADAALGLPRERHSLGVRRLAVVEAVRGSYDAAVEAVTRCCGPVCGKRQAERLVRAAAGDAASFYAARVPQPAGAATLLVLSVDGKGVVMRPDGLRPATRAAAERATRTFRTRLAGGEKGNRKRMATLAAVYDAEPAPRRPHDVIAPPGGRSGERERRKGPVACAKWLTGSVRNDAADVVRDAFDQAESRDPTHERTWVVLVDGACHQLELIQAEARRRGVTLHIVLDFVHVIEKLWSASRCFHPATDPACEDWVAVKAARILAGAASEAVSEIRAQADALHLTADQRHAADTACQYLENKQEFLGYDQALREGWPIASGIIEGAARHLIADRLEITGSRWSIDGAEAVLVLRAIISNGDFEDYWTWHIRKEHERLYPDAGQHVLHLTA